MAFIAQGLHEDAKLDLNQAREHLRDAIECFYMASARQSLEHDRELIAQLVKLRKPLETSLVELREIIADNGILATDGGPK